MRPIIGILAEIDNERAAKVQYSYVSAIEEAGGSPLLLPYATDSESFERFASVCDGFFFTGGADVDPHRYGEEPTSFCGPISYFRDELEFKAFEEVMKTDKPILAVCRGAQLVNVALGGTLYQDIPSEIDTPISHKQTEDKDRPSHGVRILADTPLFSLIGKERMSANSFHHQAIKKIGTGLKIMALADDGIVEAVYHTQKRYLRAYQWHPERLCDKNDDNSLIFLDFINACNKES